jgi:hypothetical protein
MKANEKISVLLEFSQAGNLKGIFLNANTEHDQIILQKGLSRLLKHEKFSLVKRIFRGIRDGTK